MDTWIAVTALLGFLSGGATATFLGRRRRWGSGARDPERVPEVAAAEGLPSTDAASGEVEAQVVDATVVQELIELVDRLTSRELRRRLASTLGGLSGVELAVVSEGQSFDPSRFRCTGNASTNDVALDGCVSELTVPALFGTDGEILRFGEVYVYSTEVEN